MATYKANYDTRCLYRQEYVTEDGINVASSVYAVIWSYTAGLDTTTTRIRVTTMSTSEGGECTPAQGLIEQWKGEGWVVMDEFCDGETTFMVAKEFEDHMMTLAKAFLLGIPVNSETDSSEPDEDPPAAPKKDLGKFKGPVIRFKNKLSPKTTESENTTSRDVEEAMSKEVEEIKIPDEVSNEENDDDDDDGWI